MAYKKAVRRKRQRPNTRNKIKRKSKTRKKRALKKKRVRKRELNKRKVPRKKTNKNKPRINNQKISRRKPVKKKSTNIARNSSKKKSQSCNTLVRKRAPKRRSLTGHTKASGKCFRRGKLVEWKSDKKKIVGGSKVRKSTNNNSCVRAIMNTENIERSGPTEQIISTSSVKRNTPKRNCKRKNFCKRNGQRSTPDLSSKKAMQSIRSILRSKQSFKKRILSGSNFERSTPSRIPNNENASHQQTVSRIGSREKLFEKYQSIERLHHVQSHMPSEKLQPNEPLSQQLMRNDILFEHNPKNENLSEEVHTNKPATSNIPNWLQAELNESTSVEPISSAITTIGAPTHPQNHYYEIQEVYYERDGESQLIHLRDIGMFDNFEAARERFIQNYFKKIRNGCKPVRSNDFSYPWLYEAIESSRNSIYGYWLRVSDPEFGGIHETFLRKKQWCSSSHVKGM